jgi:uncharacterized protein YkwD
MIGAAWSRAIRLLAVGALALTAACAGDSDSLVERINAYRTTPQTCAGKAVRPLGPFAPVPALARVQIASAQHSLQDALKLAGYQAAQAQAIVVSRRLTAAQTMLVLEDRYCDVLLSPQFSEVGIARDGWTWRVVLAQPLLSSDLGDWTEAGREVLQLVNKARTAGRNCGTQRFGPAQPLEWNAKLASAALVHSRDMAKRNYVAHAAPDGTKVAERAAREGYEWQGIAENIASGQGSPQQAVAGWLASPDHCVNIMQPEFTEMGAAYVVNPEGDTMIYWTQVFGTPRR